MHRNSVNVYMIQGCYSQSFDNEHMPEACFKACEQNPDKKVKHVIRWRVKNIVICA